MLHFWGEGGGRVCRVLWSGMRKYKRKFGQDMYQNLFLFVLSLSPLYNRTDWLCVKHQFTCLPTLLSFFNGFVVVCFVSSFILACRLTSITSRSMYHTPGLWRGQRRTVKGWWSPSRPAPWWSSRAGTACATWPRSTPSWASATPFRWELLFGQFFPMTSAWEVFLFVFSVSEGPVAALHDVHELIRSVLTSICPNDSGDVLFQILWWRSPLVVPSVESTCCQGYAKQLKKRKKEKESPNSFQYPTCTYCDGATVLSVLWYLGNVIQGIKRRVACPSSADGRCWGSAD